jgi:hypothetical protein
MQNTASGSNASVSGGNVNIASGIFASVSGGLQNTASGNYTSVSGGQSNIASGERSSVSGGWGCAPGLTMWKWGVGLLAGGGCVPAMAN